MNKSFLERINFFHGFLTSADDWNKAQDYHIKKGMFHNKYLHVPGVVFEDDKLEVTAVNQGTAINVAPGFAIDGEGRDLYLPEPEQIIFVPSRYHPPTTVYVSIRHNEEKVHKKQSAANPEYSDYTFIREEPLVEITRVEPDNHHAIELARIELSADVTRISNADDRKNPKPNQIDLRHVKEAGSKAERKKISFVDLGVKIHDSKTYVRTEEPSSITLDTVKKGDAHRFYLVSVYPEREADIRWCIESSRSTARNVQHKLILENLSKRAVNVSYRVYRLE